MPEQSPSERERRIEAAARALWDRAEERAFNNTRYPVTPWEGAHDLDRAELREEAAFSLDAAEEAVPMVGRNEFELAVQQLGECEEALGDERAQFAAFREETLRPLNERGGGGSIESLSWDELLGVAVRNLNQALDLGRRVERAEAEVARLRERLSRLEAAARAVLPLLGMGPAQEFSAEPYRAKARLALVLDEGTGT